MTQRWRFPNDSTMHCSSSVADPPCSRVSCAHCVQNPWCRILWGPLGPVCCTLGFCLFNQLNIAQRWKQLQHHETSHVSLVFGKTSVLSSESWGKGDGKRAEGEGWASHSIPFLKDLERTHSFALVQERREYTRIAPQHIAPSSYIPEMSRNQDISEYVFGFLDLDHQHLEYLERLRAQVKPVTSRNESFLLDSFGTAVAQLTGHHLSASASRMDAGASIVAVRLWFQDISVVAMITS